MDISYRSLQAQYDKIYSYFITTTETFDELEWDGRTLAVWLGGTIIEKYKYEDLKVLIFSL